MNKGLRILKLIAIVFIFVLFVFLFAYITMVLWNYLMPSIFNLPFISFGQALGLLLLSKILFSGFWKWGGYRGGMHWKHRYNQKLSGMTPEERERFKQRMNEKWCRKDPTPPAANSGISNV